MLKCRMCSQDVPENKVKYYEMKLCCSVQRLPLCPNCWTKQSKSGAKT